MFKNHKGLIVGCLIVTSLVSGIIALILSLVNSQSITQPSPDKYGMVFDAGSSHTTLYLYQWPANKENDTGIVKQVYTCDVPGPGISSYAENPSQAGESLKPCLDQVLRVIPTVQQRETTVLLGATAGMRLLRMQNATKTQLIFDEISKTLGGYPMNFQGARILTGNEEGSLGWITVNYLLGTFIGYTFLGSWVHPTSGQTFGAMDLGGASTQMTFQPVGFIQDKDTEMFFRLYGYNYTIYTHSYLCYGQDQVFKRLLANLLQGWNSGKVQNPCYAKSYTANISLASVFNSPCVPSGPADLADNVIVEGSGDPTECHRAIANVFNFSACTNNANCSFDGVFQPPVQGQFYAFSAFYYTFNFLNLTCGQSLAEANRTVWNFCTSNWPTLIESFPSENRKRLLEYCSSGMYILTLLLDGYKFDSQTWNKIHFSKQAGSMDIGWTLGYMLNLTNMIPSEAPTQLKAHSYSLWVGAIFFIVLSIAVGLLAVSLHCFCRNLSPGQSRWS
ncbi:ectonucleoside triphosphate diphosphohydrolase 8 [Xenopus laevis]|uniref:Ectonucleoside triphosphate diphosphohydrolase 8 n=2 Tax=Xenopus laevis TaxID=8355 RepID=A0A974H6S8_XENLA|nr:ectonucleoside triphosphate diphosphohydrolase 8 [Xenopus laevis]OCT66932.1 hypothetical protein XELAEV_18038214mg [Xenopus laevis]